MDGLTDGEVEGIWERLKKYIDPTTLKGANKKGVLDNLERSLKNLRSAKQGSGLRLFESGFVDRAQEIETIDNELNEQIQPDIGGGGGPKPKEKRTVSGKDVITQILLNDVPLRANSRTGRVNIKGRSFAAKNLKLTLAGRGERNAFYVSRKGTGLISWGFF